MHPWKRTHDLIEELRQTKDEQIQSKTGILLIAINSDKVNIGSLLNLTESQYRLLLIAMSDLQQKILEKMGTPVKAIPIRVSG